MIVFTLGLFVFCLGLPSAHQLILHRPFTLPLFAWFPALPLPLNWTNQELSSYHEVGGHLFVSSIYIVLARLRFQLAVSGGWVLIGWIMSLFHGSSSLYWCAGMAAHERCSQLGKLCEIFAGCSRYFFLGWVLNERACLFNWVWFRWPIPSSLIWESLGTNFQLDLISIVFFIYCYIVQPCHALSIPFWMSCHVRCNSDAYCPWYHLSHHGQLGFSFFSGMCLFKSDWETYKGVPMLIVFCFLYMVLNSCFLSSAQCCSSIGIQFIVVGFLLSFRFPLFFLTPLSFDSCFAMYCP
jgi:hypothetical protein